MEMLPRIHACGYETLEGDEFDRERRKNWEDVLEAHEKLREYDPTHDENGNVAYKLFRPTPYKPLPRGTQWAGGRNGLQFEDEPRAGTIPKHIDMSLVYRHPLKGIGIVENPVMATELYRHGYGEEDPLKALKTTLATSSCDASEARDIAWMYGIVCGWDEAALAELRAKFGWPVEQTDRLKRLHAAYEKLMKGEA